MSTRHGSTRTVKRLLFSLLVVCLIAPTFATDQDALAATGEIKGRAATAQGSVLGINANVNRVTLPANGSAVGQSLPLSVGANADLGLVGNLTVGVSADSVATHCEGVPFGATVRAECYSRIEGLTVGLTLDTLLTSTTAPIVTAGVLEGHSTSTSTGGAATSSNAGTTIANLCVFTNGATCASVNGTATLNVSALGVVTGTVAVRAEQTRTSDSGVSGSGLTVTMLAISLQTVLGPLVQIDIAVADSFVGGVVADVTPPPSTATPTPPAATATPTGTPPAPTATPSSTPGGPAATATPTPPFEPVGPGEVPLQPPTTPTPTASPPPAPGATKTPTPPPAPGKTATPAGPGPGQPTPRPPATGEGRAAGSVPLPAWFGLLVIAAGAAGVGGFAASRR